MFLEIKSPEIGLGIGSELKRSVKDESWVTGMNVDDGTICKNKNVAEGLSFPLRGL